MLDREYTIPECKIIYSGGEWTEDATKEHRLIPLVRPMEPEPVKREVVSRFRRAEPLRRERPAVIPREVPEKRLAQSAVTPAPKVPKPARLIKGMLSAVVNRWLLPSGYRYCSCGRHAVPVPVYDYKRQGCKPCESARKAEWMRQHPEHVAGYHSEYRKATREQQRRTRNAWRSRNPEWVKAATKRAYDKIRNDPAKWEHRKAQARAFNAKKSTLI